MRTDTTEVSEAPRDLVPLIYALHRASTFDVAADATLNGVCAVLRDALAELKGPPKILRVALLMHDGRSPRGLVWLHMDASSAEARPSMTALARVRRGLEPVLIDVLGDTGGDEFSSRSAFKDQGVTHILALPLLSSPSSLAGLISVELKTTLVTPLVEDHARRAYGQLQPLLLVAAPALMSKPRGPLLLTEDSGIPVLGPEMSELLIELRDYADMDDVLLLRGETGTGKTHLARWCHQRSPRTAGPFVDLRLGETPPALCASQLFGHKKGSFSGADRDADGLVARARGGTLFVDEIDKLDLQTQALLLNLVDRGTFRPLGGSKEIEADVRVIVGSNADLEQLISRGRFLEDLFYRINVLSVRLPPLRERPGDIGGWAAWYAHRMGHKSSVSCEVILDDDARDLLTAHPWPGNLRELESVVKRAYLRARRDAQGALIRLQRHHVEHALRGFGGPGRPLADAMSAAASAFVAEAQRGDALTLKDADAFRGFVLRAAGARLGVREAYQLFGLDKAIAQGNYQRLYREQVAVAEALEARLDEGKD